MERNNHGHAVLLGLRETCGYPNLYREEEKRRGVKVVTAKTTGNTTGKKPKYGWNTNESNRALMLDGLKVAIEGDFDDDEQHFEPEFEVNDEVLVQEGLTFEESNGKYEAAEGYNDDTIFAWGIAWQMVLRSFRLQRGSISSGSIYLGQRREAT